MTGKTHVLGGMGFALGGFMCLQSANMLIPDVSEPLQLSIILPYAIWASTFPDLDQDKDSMGKNNPIDLLFQKMFKVVGAKHRGSKSHVVPMFFTLVLYVAVAFSWIFNGMNGTEITIIGLITMGLFLGLLSHFVLDCMTRQGVDCFGLTIRLVPNTDMFGTGTMYETIVRRIIYFIDCALFIILFI